jgi:hypothetical protein
MGIEIILILTIAINYYNKKYNFIIMKEIFYYSIFAIILYFVLSHVFDNFNLEQENFDPSLVPVSSIVTLAKVAQKLVNGNGTLTNPGNLQIGSSASAPGNLTVTGNTTVNGTLFMSNDRWQKSNDGKNRLHFGVNTGTHYGSGDGNHYFRTGADGNTPDGMILNSNGNLTVTGNTTINGSITAGSASNAQTIKTWGLVNSNSLTVGPGSIQFNGPVAAGANLSVGTNLSVGGNSTVTGNIVSSSSLAAIVPGSTASTMTYSAGTVVSSMDTGGFLMLWGSSGALIGDSTKPIRFGTATNTKADGWSEYGRFDNSGNFNIGGNGYSNRNLIVNGTTRLNGETTITSGGASITGGLNVKTGGLKICDTADSTKCATLTYDSAKGILRLDSGLEVRNALGKPNDNNPGIITPNLVFSHTDLVWQNDTKVGIWDYANRILTNSWLPNGSQVWVGPRSNDEERQLFGAVKRTHSGLEGRIIPIHLTPDWNGANYYN